MTHMCTSNYTGLAPHHMISQMASHMGGHMCFMQGHYSSHSMIPPTCQTPHANVQVRIAPCTHVPRRPSLIDCFALRFV